MTTASSLQGRARQNAQRQQALKGTPQARRQKNYDDSLEGRLQEVLDETQTSDDGAAERAAREEAAATDAPLVRLVQSLLLEAVKLDASDIHIEPFPELLRIRYRIDGALQEIQKIPYKLGPSITSRIKILAGLDICERRVPQDGTLRLKTEGVEADFRVSTLPTVYGENVVMRVLRKTGVKNDLSKVGIPESQLNLLREAINRPDGLVLVTGPTGSGKTTTLYAALNELNDISIGVFTAEDPVEGDIPGVTQAQVNPGVGYTFASILRSFLRQDPDVILVGEIRDQETAEISIKAALTGHLVLSTLHTNCAASSITRLADMGIAPYLISSSVTCVAAQRLVRRVCADCKQPSRLPDEALQKLGSAGSRLPDGQVWHGTGCKVCRNSGYKGRAGIYEVLSVTDEVRRLILCGASKDEIKDQARVDGMITLREAGLDLVREGITTVEEVLGTTNEDPELGSVLARAKTRSQVSVPAQPTVIVEAAQQAFAMPAPASNPDPVVSAPQFATPPAPQAQMAPQQAVPTPPVPPTQPKAPAAVSAAPASAEGTIASRWKSTRGART